MGLELQPDQTFFIQLALFLVVFFSLNSLVIQPALRVFEKRKNATDGASEAVDSLRVQIEALMKEYEQKIQQARLQGIEIKEKIRREGEAEAAKIMAHAKDASEAYLKQIRSEVRCEQEAAQIQIKKVIEEVAQKMADRVFEKDVA